MASRIAGAEIHGFHTLQDLDVVRMMEEEAKTRWLRPNEIHAVLYNHTFFTIHVKPVPLPRSGTIVLFDRKMLRNFRKDGHNWKKKKDGKTVKEAHEHLKVGNEERIHVYYAHGEDNPGFVRRCYWLLDKKYEHIVLVHYRETSEMQDSPVTPVISSSASSTSDTSSSKIISEETDTGANRAYYLGPTTPLAGESIELGENMSAQNHEILLHEINTLEWEDLLASNDPSNFNIIRKDDISCLQQQNQIEISDSRNNDTLLPSNNLPERLSSFAQSAKLSADSASDDVKLPTSGFVQNKEANSNLQNQEFDMVSFHQDGFNPITKDGFQTQDSFGRWIDHIMTDTPGSLNNLLVESPASTGPDSSTSTVIDHSQSATQQQVFCITDISPTWSFAVEETKIIIVGYFHASHSQLMGSNLLCVFGESCVPAEMIQVGVYRCMALPRTPGFINFYLSFDGLTPISQVMTFEYRVSSLENGSSRLEDNSKWEEFQVQLRLARLIFSSTNSSLNILSSKISPNALKEAKKFALGTASVDKDWAYLIKSIGKNEMSFPQAKNNLFEIILKNKLQEWLLCRVVEGCKITIRDRQGQGVLHLCAILGYTWAIRLFSLSGLSLDFRDSRGWTALHWAAFYGREKMVAVLLSAGANPSLVADPTSEFPGGCYPADLASKNGYEGLAAYLAEKGLTEHFRLMSISGNISGSLQSDTTDSVNPGNLSEEQLCQKDTLTAYRNAAEAAARIQSAFRENSFKMRKKAAQISNPESEARTIIAAMKIQHAFRKYESRKQMAAAVRIQYRFRTWKMRKEFLNLRRQAIKIQAAYRALKVRRHYHKLLWSVGILEKGILRWRQKRKGLRGLQVETTEVPAEQKQDSDVEEDFFRISRKQAEDRIERSVVRVQALFRSHQAQQEYRRMKMAYDQVQLEELLDTDLGVDG